MKTPAQRVQEEIDKMIKGIPHIPEENVELRSFLGKALLNASQTLENFREIERLTRNTERLN